MVFQVCRASSELLLIKTRAKKDTESFSLLQPDSGHSLVRHHTQTGAGTHLTCRSSSSKVCPLPKGSFPDGNVKSEKYHGLHSIGASWWLRWRCFLQVGSHPMKRDYAAKAWSRSLPLCHDQHQSPDVSSCVCCSLVCANQCRYHHTLMVWVHCFVFLISTPTLNS